MLLYDELCDESCTKTIIPQSQNLPPFAFIISVMQGYIGGLGEIFDQQKFSTHVSWYICVMNCALNCNTYLPR